MVETKRKKGESFESLFRRFQKKIQQSGKILQSRKIRFHQKEKSRNLRRASALRRLSIKEEKEFLKKIGKLPEDE